MSTTIERTHPVVVRKYHYCAYCGETIMKGHPAQTWVNVENGGDIARVHVHPECYHIGFMAMAPWDDFTGSMERSDIQVFAESFPKLYAETYGKVNPSQPERTP